MKFRDLTASEIEVRVAQINEKRLCVAALQRRAVRYEHSRRNGRRGKLAAQTL